MSIEINRAGLFRKIMTN